MERSVASNTFTARSEAYNREAIHAALRQPAISSSCDDLRTRSGAAGFRRDQGRKAASDGRTAQMITTTNSSANSESVPQAQSPRGAAASKASRSAT